MDYVAKIIGYAVTLAFALQSIGQLPRATRWLISQMEHGPQLMSLSRLNQSLVGTDGLPQHHQTRKPK